MLSSVKKLSRNIVSWKLVCFGGRKEGCWRQKVANYDRNEILRRWFGTFLSFLPFKHRKIWMVVRVGLHWFAVHSMHLVTKHHTHKHLHTLVNTCTHLHTLANSCTRLHTHKHSHTLAYTRTHSFTHLHTLFHSLFHTLAHSSTPSSIHSSTHSQTNSHILAHIPMPLFLVQIFLILAIYHQFSLSFSLLSSLFYSLSFFVSLTLFNDLVCRPLNRSSLLWFTILVRFRFSAGAHNKSALHLSRVTALPYVHQRQNVTNCSPVW